MTITETKITNGDLFYEGSITVTITTENGSGSCFFGAGEPEDNCLARGLNDAFIIKNMLEMAYNAGKNGEESIITVIEDTEE